MLVRMWWKTISTGWENSDDRERLTKFQKTVRSWKFEDDLLSNAPWWQCEVVDHQRQVDHQRERQVTHHLHLRELRSSRCYFWPRSSWSCSRRRIACRRTIWRPRGTFHGGCCRRPPGKTSCWGEGRPDFGFDHGHSSWSFPGGVRYLLLVLFAAPTNNSSNSDSFQTGTYSVPSLNSP